MQNVKTEIRLDKWLWAARFFKTRSLAKTAIEGGKVHYNGQRCKVSKTVEVGAELKIAQGFDEKIVQVLALSDNRGPAAIAQTLYQETDASQEQREARSLQRKLTLQAPNHKPDKKERRQLLSVKQHFDEL